MKTLQRSSQLTALFVGVLLFMVHTGTAQDTGVGGLGGGIDKPNTNRAGTNGAAELLVPLTARYASLGNSTTSVLSDMNGLEALFANPAGLSNNMGTSTLFSRVQYVADIGVNYFGLAQRFGENNLAIAVSAWDMGDIHRQTEINPEKTDATFRVSFINAGLSYARALTDRIAAGATLKVVNHTIDDMTANGIVFDAGMSYVIGETGVRLGVALKNIGRELQYSGTGLGRRVRLPDQVSIAAVNTLAIESEGMQYPTLLNFGMSYQRNITSSASVTVLGHFQSNSFDDDIFSGGMELGFREIVMVRGAYSYTRQTNVTMYQGYSFGGGLNLNVAGTDLVVDYAVVPTDYFASNVQYLTLSVSL